jgi:predicted nuclease of predicted toxin-antitoxin system
MDVHVPYAVTTGLRLRGVDALTAQEDEARQLDDPILLDCAADLGRVLFTQDDDLLREAKMRQQTEADFASVIYAHQLNVTIGECVSDLELIALASEPEEYRNCVVYLPLKQSH